MGRDLLSIIIPARNEEKRIEKTLGEYEKFFLNIRKKGRIKDFEILIVLNACEDNTVDIAKKYEQMYKEIRCLNFEQAGKGFAIKEGFKDALKRGFDLIGFVDADMSTLPDAFYDLVKNIGKFDGIIASRWMKGSIIKTKQTFLRKITSNGFNFLVRSFFLMPYSDTQCGAKLFKREALEKIVPELALTAWAFDVDLLHKLKINKLRVKEIPTVWENKEGSGLNLTKVPIKMFTGIMRLRLLNSPFKFIVRLYNKLPEKIMLHHKL
jgi:glycosyltransferase involved in cell wall biosynthesis